MPHRRRIHWPLVLFWLFLSGSACVYVVLIPWADSFLSPEDPSSPQAQLSLLIGEDVSGRAATFFVVGWFFSLGASFGSFINVVAWRIPHGETILGSSRCPRCHVNISRWDNVPVVGWIQVRGHCRNCHSPISPRYLIVELLLGSIFSVLGVLLFFRSGIHLPNGPWYPLRSNASWVNFRVEPDLIRIYLYHAFLFTVLLAMALMRWDRLRMPSRFLFFCGFVAFTVPAIWPDVHPVLWNGESPIRNAVQPIPWQLRLTTTLVGLFVGGICGAVLGSIWPAKPFTSHRAETVMELGCAAELCGAVLGWQAVILVLSFAAATRAGSAVVERGSAKVPNVPPAGFMLAATFALVIAWNHIHCVSRSMTGPGGWILIATVLLVSALAVGLSRRMLRSKMAQLPETTSDGSNP